MHNWKLFGGLFFLIILVSCKTVNSNRILFPEEGSALIIESLPPSNSTSQIIPGDVLSIDFYPNNGELKIIGKVNEQSADEKRNSSYVVDQQGNVTLPLIGSVQVNGKTVDEVKVILIGQLSTVIREPFVQVSIENERVVLFSGKDAGKVIPLTQQNTTLVEVIALGGGLKNYAKAKEVHLLRKINGSYKVYRLDISSLDNMKPAATLVHNHDIVVVNYYPRTVQNSLQEINPWLNLAVAGLALVSIILRFYP